MTVAVRLVALYFGQPVWRFLVEYLPLWLAPNLVTLIGLGFMLFGYLVVYYYAPLISV